MDFWSQSTRRGFIAGAGMLSLAASATSVSAPAVAGPTSTLSIYGFEPGLIYFNTASAGPTPTPVLEATLAAWRKLETNPVRMAYGKVPGTIAVEADEVRAKAADLLGCCADEILLTRGTTDAMNTLSQSIRLREGDRVLTTDQEHEGGETCWLHRQRRDGIAVDRVTIPIGNFDVAAILGRFAAAIEPSTKVISVSHVLSSTGLKMPIAQISALARSRGILCVVDGAQALGAMPVNVKNLGCHAYAASGHKWMMGPKGTGILYVSRDAGEAIQPVEWDLGKEFICNSSGLGTLTLAVGLGRAAETLLATGAAAVEMHNLALRNRFWSALSNIPSLRLASPPPGQLATALIAVALPERIDSMALRERMHDRHGVVVKMVEKRRFNGIRFSPHVFNDERQVDIAVAALREELAAWPSA
jgi:selenocysteine lyase/cysteine desulfurase